MKVRGFLTALCVVSLIGIFVFGITAMVYAKAAPVVEETKGGAAAVEMPPTGNVNPDTKGQDEGSPMDGWKAIVNADKKEGDIITTEEFAGMRNWSARTRGYELQSLVAIGVLARVKRGEYRLLVTATAEQINQVNEQAKNIVNRKGKDGSALGIDSYRLDAKYLGEGNPGKIADVVKQVTGSTVTPEQVPADFVQEDINAGNALPASVAINGDISFTVNGNSVANVAGIANAAEQQALLAALVDTRMVSPEGIVKGDAADFSASKVKTVMFEEEFVTTKPREFKAAFDQLAPDVTAVIVAITKNNGDIETALKEAGLLEQWGNRIVVMGVAPNSPAAQAFRRLFGDKNVIDLRDQGIDKILESKDLVEGLKGAV